MSTTHRKPYDALLEQLESYSQQLRRLRVALHGEPTVALARVPVRDDLAAYRLRREMRRNGISGY